MPAKASRNAPRSACPPTRDFSLLMTVPFEAGKSGVYCSNASALQDQCASEEDPNKCLFNDCCKSCDNLGSGVGTCDAPTTLEALPVKPRYWRATELEDTIYRCFYERTCKGSPGGTNKTSYGDGLCRKGHKGPLCNVCENGYYFSPTELQCAKCRRASMAIYVIVVLVVVALLAILVYASLDPGEQGKEIRGALLRRAKSRVRRSSSNISVESASDAIKEQSSSALTRSKIVISCYQIVAGIQELFPTIPWPVAYEQVARFFGLASLDISSLAHASCVFPGIDYIWSMEIATLWPIVVLLVTYLVFRRTKYRENWTYFAFLLIFLVFPSNSAMVLRYFSCVKFDARGRSPRTIKVLMVSIRAENIDSRRTSTPSTRRLLDSATRRVLSPLDTLLDSRRPTCPLDAGATGSCTGRDPRPRRADPWFDPSPPPCAALTVYIISLLLRSGSGGLGQPRTRAVQRIESF